MKKIVCLLFLLSLSHISYAEKNRKISPEECRAATEGIIKVSEDALPMAEDKKNAEILKNRIADWKQRLSSDEDACNLYQDILKNSTNF
jgi:hypothetical protein